MLKGREAGYRATGLLCQVSKTKAHYSYQITIASKHVQMLLPALKRPLVSLAGRTLLSRHILAPSRMRDPCTTECHQAGC